MGAQQSLAAASAPAAAPVRLAVGQGAYPLPPRSHPVG